MKWRTLPIMLTAGLVGLVSGCDNHDVSKTNELVELTQPSDCEVVKDIRYEGSSGGFYYQILCENSQKELELYTRDRTSSQWTKITVK